MNSGGRRGRRSRTVLDDPRRETEIDPHRFWSRNAAGHVRSSTHDLRLVHPLSARCGDGQHSRCRKSPSPMDFDVHASPRNTNDRVVSAGMVVMHPWVGRSPPDMASPAMSIAKTGRQRRSESASFDRFTPVHVRHRRTSSSPKNGAVSANIFLVGGDGGTMTVNPSPRPVLVACVRKGSSKTNPTRLGRSMVRSAVSAPCALPVVISQHWLHGCVRGECSLEAEARENDEGRRSATALTLRKSGEEAAP